MNKIGYHWGAWCWQYCWKQFVNTWLFNICVWLCKKTSFISPNMDTEMY